MSLRRNFSKKKDSALASEHLRKKGNSLFMPGSERLCATCRLSPFLETTFSDDVNTVPFILELGSERNKEQTERIEVTTNATCVSCSQDGNIHMLWGIHTDGVWVDGRRHGRCASGMKEGSILSFLRQSSCARLRAASHGD